MVIVKDFEFQIVSAVDKIPFKEHRKGGNTYVEVEPDAEYFLSIRKLTLSDRVVCGVEIDGKSLGYTMFFTSPMTVFHGICVRSNGIETDKALKFVKASFTSGDKAIGSTMAGIGKIKMEVHGALYAGKRKRGDIEAVTFGAPTIKTDCESKKNIRSSEGHHIEMKTFDKGKLHNRYHKGPHLYTITLHYCAAPGLIGVVVLPKPPLWDYHRLVRLSETTSEEKEWLNKSVISIRVNNKGNEILELDDNSENNEDSRNDDADSKNDPNAFPTSRALAASYDEDYSLPLPEEVRAKSEKEKTNV